jgi:hypothetical protein
MSDLGTLHQAVNYYQLALLHVQSEQQLQLRLRLGKVYSELMYFEEEEKHAQCAIDSFDIVLEKSHQEEERREASNGKSRAWFWICAITRDGELLSDTIQSPFQVWAQHVATRYPEDPVAMFYFAASHLWKEVDTKEHQVWFNLAWGLFQINSQQPPPEFHIFYSLSVYWYFQSGSRQPNFLDLPAITMAMEQFSLFIENADLKTIHIVQRFVVAS